MCEGERLRFVNEGGFHCLDVVPVLVQDGGEWTCLASNDAGRASSSCHLNVLGETLKPSGFVYHADPGYLLKTPRFKLTTSLDFVLFYIPLLSSHRSSENVQGARVRGRAEGSAHRTGHRVARMQGRRGSHAAPQVVQGRQGDKGG